MGNFAGSEETEMEKAKHKPFGLEFEKIQVACSRPIGWQSMEGLLVGFFFFFFFKITGGMRKREMTG